MDSIPGTAEAVAVPVARTLKQCEKLIVEAVRRDSHLAKLADTSKLGLIVINESPDWFRVSMLKQENETATEAILRIFPEASPKEAARYGAMFVELSNGESSFSEEGSEERRAITEGNEVNLYLWLLGDYSESEEVIFYLEVGGPKYCPGGYLMRVVYKNGVFALEESTSLWIA